MWDLSFQPFVMMVTSVPGQQTLNSSKHGPTSSFAVGPLTPSPASAIKDIIALGYQNLLIIFLAFYLLTKRNNNNDIVACGDQVQMVRESLVVHLWFISMSSRWPTIR
ncbi:hypothetical protein AMTRI_Chr01g135710 [Amborella trichopoda]